MSVNLIQEVGNVFLTYTEKPSYIEMKIRGKFVGEVLGHTKVDLSNTYLKIQILGEVIADPFIIYHGNVLFYEVKCYDENKKRMKCYYSVNNDEWENQSLVWSVSTDKYEDIDKTNANSNVYDGTKLYYTTQRNQYFVNGLNIKRNTILGERNELKELENLRSKNALRK